MKDRPNRNTGWACLESYLEASTAGDGLVRDNADSVGHGCSPNTSYSKATPSGSFSANQASAASWLANTLREMPRSLTGTNTGTFATHTHRTAPNQDNSELQGDVKTKMGGRHVGIIEWLLVWLIVNALFVVWRILVTTEIEIPDRSIRKMPNVADL